MGGRNRTWTRENAGSFNPLGRRDDRPYGGKGKGKGSREREVVVIREDRSEGRRSVGQMDKVTMRLLNLYCQKQWNGQSGMLDLSAMWKSEDLSDLNCNLNTTQFCDKLASVIAKGELWAKSLNSLNLADNNISNLRNISEALKQHDIRVQNLSLSGNKLKELSEIDCLIDLKLREIILAGSPIAAMGDAYHRYIVKKLRTVELLDGVSVKEWRHQLLPKLPDPRDSCLSDDLNAKLVPQMAKLYFAAVDEGNFDALIDAYDSKCIFSHITEPCKRFYGNQVAKNYHSNLLLRSHNVKHAFTQKHPCQYIFHGRPAIIEFLRNQMYRQVQTRHDVGKFKADAITMGETVVVTLHGTFTYTVQGDATEHVRCFDRVFILRPNRVGTEWPARIANDTVTIRTVQDHAILMPSGLSNPASSSSTSVPELLFPPQAMPPSPMPLLGVMLDVKTQVMQQTGLNDMFASLLLKESDQNVDRAIALFKQNQALGLIPAEAFHR